MEIDKRPQESSNYSRTHIRESQISLRGVLGKSEEPFHESNRVWRDPLIPVGCNMLGDKIANVVSELSTLLVNLIVGQLVDTLVLAYRRV